LAIVNRDDQSFGHLEKSLHGEKYRKINTLTYGLDDRSNLRAKNIENTTNGLRFDIEWANSTLEIQTSLIGEYNTHNILAAVAASMQLKDLKGQCAIASVSSFTGVPGRMERIELGQDFTAIVDFAHTPNALKVTLEAARKIIKKRVIAVFGSAGLRDREKRRMMAAISIAFADISILTAEDPRTERLDDILSEMKDEAQKHGGIENETFYCIPDRGRAISKAVELADEDDLVIICGKGHEQSMCFGETEFPWDDRTALKSALSSLLKIEGPEMPYLPTQDN
jgi:UDP-N-acetylmuramoyl-L-alanyl-D-glutamate--2,6-diaminopimelate ligase